MSKEQWVMSNETLDFMTAIGEIPPVLSNPFYNVSTHQGPLVCSFRFIIATFDSLPWQKTSPTKWLDPKSKQYDHWTDHIGQPGIQLCIDQQKACDMHTNPG